MEPLKTNINCTNSVSSQPSDFTTPFFDEESVSMTASEFNIVQNMQKSQNEMNLTQIQQSRIIMTVLGNFEELQRNFKQLQINYNSLQQKFEKSQEVNEKSIMEIRDKADNQNYKITKIAEDALQIAKEAKSFVDQNRKALDDVARNVQNNIVEGSKHETEIHTFQNLMKELKENTEQKINTLDQKLQNVDTQFRMHIHPLGDNSPSGLPKSKAEQKRSTIGIQSKVFKNRTSYPLEWQYRELE